jgi:hypothetical protein
MPCESVDDGDHVAARRGRVGSEGYPRAFDRLSEVIVEGREDVARFRVVAALELEILVPMAAGAVARSDDHRDRRPVVVKGIGVSRFGAMAFEASDACLCVRTTFPLSDDSGIRCFMAGHARFRCVRQFCCALRLGPFLTGECRDGSGDENACECNEKNDTFSVHQ